MTFTLRVFRYGIEHSFAHETVDNAVKNAYGCHESGEAYFLDIVKENGQLVLTHDQILSRFSLFENSGEV